ncbi:MAG: LuxR C-terminal-related transcriptional regulator [Rudaea sp.]
MAIGLLATKFHIPPPLSRPVPRPRLMQRLDRAMTYPLTLLAAPAGFGKTTLLSEWLHDSQRPAAWISVDSDDNDLARFLAYVIAALDSIQPGIGQVTLGLLQAPPHPSVQVLLTPLLNEIAAMPQNFVLVLDDLHHVEDASVHAALGFLLEHLPTQMHLVIASRTELLVPLARLRARGQLNEIRAGDLRFTHEEAARFLSLTMALDLSKQEMEMLEARTEGWVAGLQMAGLSLQGAQDVSPQITTFGGSDRFILDYLTEEVLRRLPESMQQFLLQTSILDRMCGELCEAVSGSSDGQAKLEALERANAFLVPLDNERHWYRYHHLFADLLRARLVHVQPDLVSVLLRRAAQWHARQGALEEAIAYALRAGDFEQAAELIETTIPAMLSEGQLKVLARWISALPPQVLRSHPRLALAQIWTLFFALQFSQAEELLHQVERALTPGDSSLEGQLAFWRGVFARAHEELEPARRLFEQALEQFPADSLSWRTHAYLFLGLVHVENDLPQALVAYERARELAESCDNLHVAIAATHFFARAQHWAGRLRAARSSGDHALELARQAEGWPAVAHAHNAIALCLYEQNELEPAAEHAQKAAELGEVAGNNDYRYGALLMLARVNRARQEWQAAQRYLDQVKELGRESKRFVVAQITEEQVRLLLARNRPGEAQEYTQRSGPLVAGDSVLTRAFLETSAARVLLANHEPHAALQLLGGSLDSAERAGMGQLAFQILALQAMALEALGEPDRAVQALAHALSRAGPEGYVRTFLDEGPGLVPVLRRVASREITPPYATHLLALFEPPQRKSHASTATPPLVEPLSERELEVLRLLAEGCSNQQIASQLVLALGTVKAHLNNIYGKLEVRTRTEATARARELGLLP